MLARNDNDNPLGHLSEGPPGKTRSGGIWLSDGTEANSRTAA